MTEKQTPSAKLSTSLRNSPATKPKKVVRRLMRVLIFTFAALILGLTVLFCVVTTYGFPRWSIDALENRLSRKDHSIEIGHARYLPGKGISVKTFALYRKYVADGPLVTANAGIVDIDLIQLLRGVIHIRDIHIKTAAIHPPMFIKPPKARPPKVKISRANRPWINLPLRADHFTVIGATTTNASALLRFGPDKIELRDTRVYGSSPGAYVDVTLNGDTFLKTLDAYLEGRVMPADVLPLLKGLKTGYAVNIVSRITDNKEPGALTLTASHDKNIPNKEISITFDIEGGSYNRLPCDKISGEFRVLGRKKWEKTELSRCHITREEGSADITIATDSATKTLTFKTRSTIDLDAVIDAIPEVPLDNLRIYSCQKPPEIMTSGVVCFTNAAANRVTVTGVASNVLYKTLFADSVRFRANTSGANISIPVLSVKAYSGDISGEIHISVDHGATPVFTTLLTADGIHFGEFLQSAYNVTNTFGGELNGNLTLSGSTNPRRKTTLKGEGQLQVRDGELFRLPLFAGLTSIMAKLIPGLDFILCQSDAKIDFTISDNAIRSDKIILEGDVFSLKGHGEYNFTDNLEMSIQLRLLNPDTIPGKIMGLITFPITKLFEFKVKGALMSAEWYPENFHWEWEEKPRLIKGRIQKEVLVFE